MKLTERLAFKNGDLLVACMQMPFLESLVLNFRQSFITSYPSEAIMSLPCLKLIEIESPDIDIYPAFLGYIFPSAGCALRVCHHFDASDTLSMEANIKDLEYMRGVIARYAASFFAHHHHASDVENIQTMELDVTRNCFEFTCCESRENHFQISVHLDGVPRIEIPLYNAVLLDLVSTFTLPTTVTRLRLRCRSPLDDGFLRHAEISLRVLHSLDSIVQLETSHHILSYLGSTAESDTLFPRLEDVSMKILSHDGPETIKARIMPFLRRRLNTVPLKSLDITDYTSRCPPKDMHCFDEISGLKFVWM